MVIAAGDLEDIAEVAGNLAFSPRIGSPDRHDAGAARGAVDALLAAVGNVVAVVVGKRPVSALAVVDDAVGVAVGGPFDDVPDRNGRTWVDR